MLTGLVSLVQLQRNGLTQSRIYPHNTYINANNHCLNSHSNSCPGWIRPIVCLAIITKVSGTQISLSNWLCSSCCPAKHIYIREISCISPQTRFTQVSVLQTTRLQDFPLPWSPAGLPPTMEPSGTSPYHGAQRDFPLPWSPAGLPPTMEPSGTSPYHGAQRDCF